MSSLFEKIIITTRPILSNDRITNLLLQKKAKVIQFPMIEICQSKLNNDDVRVLKNVNDFSWLLFTSQNGVHFFFNIIKNQNINLSKKIKFGVIGKKTADELLHYGYNPSYISNTSTLKSFINELNNGIITLNDSVLFAVGNLAQIPLNEVKLIAKNIFRINVYETKPITNYSQKIAEQISKNQYDMVIFTSPSGVTRFFQILNPPHLRSASIGTSTQKALLNYNIIPKIVASKPEADIFVNELELYFLTNK